MLQQNLFRPIYRFTPSSLSPHFSPFVQEAAGAHHKLQKLSQTSYQIIFCNCQLQKLPSNISAVTNRPCTTTGQKCAALVSDQEEFVAMLSEWDKEREWETQRGIQRGRWTSNILLLLICRYGNRIQSLNFWTCELLLSCSSCWIASWLCL